MDKARDVVRRGASRFSPAKPHNNNNNNNNNNLFSGSDGVGGDFVHSERSKKERLRRLSAVGVASSSNEDCEMGCDVSERENELPLQAPSVSVGSSRRFRIPKKFLDDCNGVDHASVPRKLRSAMKKRNRESISPPFPDSKKHNQVISGAESPIKNGVKKSKLNMKQGGSDWPPKQAVTGPITKDEEEVVETLYALAGMFPNNDANEKSKLLDSESLEAKASALPQSKESPTPAFEDSAVTKDNLSLMPSKTVEDANASSNVKRSPQETAKVNSLNEPSLEEQLDLPGSKKIRTEADCSVAHLNLQTLTFLAKSENNNEKPLQDSELSLDTRLTVPQPETPLIERKPEIALGPAITVASQLEQQHTMKEPKKNGPALWPGLSSVVSHGVGSHSPSLQSSVATVPAWLDAACASSQSSFERGSSTVKVSKGSVDRRSRKRCASHVYISHLIQISQMPENQERLPLQSNQLRPQEGSKLGVLMINNFHGVRSGLNEDVSPNSVGNSTVERNSTEVKSGIFQHRFHQDQPQAALASGAYTSQKQSFDFLSLSAGSGGMEAKNSVNRAGLESLSQFQVPYFHSLAQKQTLMSFSMPQTCYTSSAYPDQFSLAAAAAATEQLQLPPYLGNAYCGPYSSSTALTKQLQQQQRLRSAQLAAQYRPVGTSTSMAQFPIWQQGRQDSPMLIPCAQAAIPPHPSSLEVLDPKYTPISQQHQQQLMAISSSLPPARLKRQDHLLPSVYEESGGAFHASGPLPLQLLCTERL